MSSAPLLLLAVTSSLRHQARSSCGWCSSGTFLGKQTDRDSEPDHLKQQFPFALYYLHLPGLASTRDKWGGIVELLWQTSKWQHEAKMSIEETGLPPCSTSYSDGNVEQIPFSLHIYGARCTIHGVHVNRCACGICEVTIIHRSLIPLTVREVCWTASGKLKGLFKCALKCYWTTTQQGWKPVWWQDGAFFFFNHFAPS